MIGRLHGKLLEKNPPQILIDVSGVGYEVDVQCQHFAISRKSAESSRSTRTSSCVKMLSFFTALPHSPNALCSVRSSRFPASVQKLRWHSFRASRSISLKTLSIGERPDSLPKSPASAKRLQNDWCWSSKVSSQAPAQRQRAAAVPTSGARADVAAALIALGYSEREAAAATKKLPEDCTVNDGLRLALKSLTH